MPLVTAASSCPRFRSLKTNDTVSGVLAGVVPKPIAPGTLAALIPGVTRTSGLLPGPVEALAAVAATGTAATTAPAASPAQRRKRTVLAILFALLTSATPCTGSAQGRRLLCDRERTSCAWRAQGVPSGQCGIYRLIFSPIFRAAIDDLPFYLSELKISWCLDAPGIHRVDLSGQNATEVTFRTDPGRRNATNAVRTGRAPSGQDGEQGGDGGEGEEHGRKREPVVRAAGPAGGVKQSPHARADDSACGGQRCRWRGQRPAGAHRHQGLQQRVASAAPGGDVVGAHLGQPRDLIGAPREQRNAGEAGPRRLAQGDQQMVASGEVRVFVGQDRE